MPSYDRKRNQRKSPLTPKKTKTFEKDSPPSSSNTKSPTDAPAVPMRVGGRVKKARILFDPSDENFPKRRLTTVEPKSQNATKVVAKKRLSSNQHMNDICYICAKGEKANDKLINCKECSTAGRIHLSCLKTQNYYLSSEDELDWLCHKCETCIVCYETAIIDTIYKCISCKSTYHLGCHDPSGQLLNPKTIQKNRFKCNHCTQPMTLNLKKATSNLSNSLSKPTNDDLSQIVNKQKTKPNSHRSKRRGFAGFAIDEICNNDEKLERNGTDNGLQKSKASTSNVVSSNQNGQSNQIFNIMISNEEVPDASNWTHNDVYKYFYKYFPNEAIVFKDQEIDGASLLLMKRHDVIKELNLKLGPALNIYAHIIRFQTKSNDMRMSWM